MATKRQIFQVCAGMQYADAFMPEAVYHDMDAEGGTRVAVARILRKRLKPIPLSPHMTNIHVTSQLVATIKSLNFASNGDNTYAGCTKGITIFAVPWHTAKAINKDLAEDKYFEAAMLKSVADIPKHVIGAKVELLTFLRGLVWVLNNYCHLLEECFSAPIAPTWHICCPSGMH